MFALGRGLIEYAIGRAANKSVASSLKDGVYASAEEFVKGIGGAIGASTVVTFVGTTTGLLATAATFVGALAGAGVTYYAVRGTEKGAKAAYGYFTKREVEKHSNHVSQTQR